MGGNEVQHRGVTYTLKDPCFGLTAEIDNEGQEIGPEGEVQFKKGVGTYKLIKIKHYIQSASDIDEITDKYMEAMPPAAAVKILNWINAAETNIDKSQTEDQNAGSDTTGGGTTD